MDPVLEEFTAIVSRVSLRAPQRRFVSNVTGTWITDEQATSAAYWAQQLRAPVMFAAGVQTLVRDGFDFLVEVGPGRTLGILARAQAPALAVAASLPGAREPLADHEVLLDALGRAWTRGAGVDWTAFYSGERRRRVPLPTYPFERQKHWIEPDEDEVERKRARIRANEKRQFPAEWLYARCWKQTPSRNWVSGADRAAPAAWVVVSDGSVVSSQVTAALEAQAPADRLFVVSAVDEAPLASLSAQGIALRIVHLGAAGSPGPSASPRMLLDAGFFGVSQVAAALAAISPISAMVKVITSGADLVTGYETIIPERATIAGACIVLPQEQPNVACQRIDVSAGADGLSPEDVDALVSELLMDAPDPQVALRAGRRWVPGVEQIDEPAHPHALRAGGHYLIVGGFGTIGLSIGCYLAQVVAKARVSIVSRTALPPEGDWQHWRDSHPADDRTSALIQKAQLLVKLGASVLTFTADTADARALGQAVVDAERAAGPIHGVVFAAGLMDETAFAPLANLDRAAVAAHFRPKLEGLPALTQALGDRVLDFCVISSSLSVLLGGMGYAAYAAANAYLDAYVHARNQRSRAPWLVVNWDAWHPFGGQLPRTSLLARLAMTPSEGVGAFDLLVRCRRVSQMFVSTSDLAARVAEHTETAASRPARAADDGTAEAGASPAGEDGDDGLTPTERVVIGIWQEVLGLSGVQPYDSFLDLGGSSLTAIQVIGRIEERTGVRVTIEEFIFQTASQLAGLVDSRGGPAAGAAAHAASGVESDAVRV
jgi:acyl transferase domain-containing protein/acyl carrier protein